MTETETSPTTTLDELFEKDPLLHTKSNIKLMIEGYRKMRSRFKAGDNKAGNLHRKPTKREIALKEAGLEGALNEKKGDFEV